jgi:hypothetical protein
MKVNLTDCSDSTGRSVRSLRAGVFLAAGTIAWRARAGYSWLLFFAFTIALSAC